MDIKSALELKKRRMNFEVAENKVIKKLVSEGRVIKNIIRLNQKRYSIIITDKESFFFMFKRDSFHSFGTMFNRIGEGDSINRDDLEKAMDFNISEIYSAFENGLICKISLSDFMKKSISWKNAEGKMVESISLSEYRDF